MFSTDEPRKSMAKKRSSNIIPGSSQQDILGFVRDGDPMRRPSQIGPNGRKIRSTRRSFGWGGPVLDERFATKLMQRSLR